MHSGHHLAGSRIINCTAQIFAQAYKTRGIPGDQAGSKHHVLELPRYQIKT